MSEVAIEDTSEGLAAEIEALRALPVIQTHSLLPEGGWIGARITEHARIEGRWLVEIVGHDEGPHPDFTAILDTELDAVSFALGAIISMANAGGDEDAGTA